MKSIAWYIIIQNSQISSIFRPDPDRRVSATQILTSSVLKKDFDVYLKFVSTIPIEIRDGFRGFNINLINRFGHLVIKKFSITGSSTCSSSSEIVKDKENKDSSNIP